MKKLLAVAICSLSLSGPIFADTQYNKWQTENGITSYRHQGPNANSVSKVTTIQYGLDIEGKARFTILKQCDSHYGLGAVSVYSIKVGDAEGIVSECSPNKIEPWSPRDFQEMLYEIERSDSYDLFKQMPTDVRIAYAETAPLE